MAPSWRNLIDFLLAEIALCGTQGASPAEILGFIGAFYASSLPSEGEEDYDSATTSPRRQHIDRLFQEKVWLWLTRHPEVSVGKNKEYNNLSLADVEHLFHDEDSEQPVRVSVSTERAWVAITGHEPDESKVLPLEFALLSIIASRKSEGILQTELVKLSGQDKRSVPKRTDMLERKGYIEKRAIQVKAVRTSLCTLRKFVREKPLFHKTETPADRGAGTKHAPGDVMDFDTFMAQLFTILRDHMIIAREDLKQLLGFADAWRWRLLSRTIRKFERIGVLRRVRAMSQYTGMKHLPSCVMMLREPTDRDLAQFREFGRSLFANRDQVDAGDADLDADLDLAGVATEEPPSSDLHAVNVVKGEGMEDAGRTLPIWTPDRMIHNLIFDVVDGAGTVGIINQEIISTCFGRFFRRPLETTLTRLVECWQLSQPPHLRHLAIVRDMTIQRTITHYIHYSAKNFAALVDSGQATWEAVEFIPKDARAASRKIPPVDAVPEIDEYGFPPLDPRDFMKKGHASLLQCIQAAKPMDYVLSSSDPVAVKQADNSYVLVEGHQKRISAAAALLKSAGQMRQATGGPPDSTKTDDVVLPCDVDAVEVAHEGQPPTKRPRMTKEKLSQMVGISEKEYLEALGLDETWTEYSVLLLDRPKPGVYVTSRGRRRPAGKRQGRPKISRMAVFKSPKLAEFPWFVNEPLSAPTVLSGNFSTANDDMVDTIELEAQPIGKPALVDEPQEVHADGRRSAERSTGLLKRTFEETQLVESDHDTEETPRRSQRGCARKHRRVTRTSAKHTPEQGADLQVQPEIAKRTPSEQDFTERAGAAHDTLDEPVRRVSKIKKRLLDHGRVQEDAETRHKRSRWDHRQPSLLTEEPEKEEGTRTSIGRRVNEAQDMAAERDGNPKIVATSVEPGQDADVDNALAGAPMPLAPSHVPETSGEVSQQIDETTAKPSGETQIILHEPEISPTPDGPLAKGRRSRFDTGGSVGFQRRRIIMDILEKAGGAFPMGKEIWYPFTTVWLRTGHKEKPDLRTIQSTVKPMIDAGKLRKLTFSGRDSKGVMVTKSILTLPNLAPDDPLILTMQRQMLAEPRHYFPPNTDIDPALRARQLPTAETRPSSMPVEDQLTVHLHHKPGTIAAREKRKTQAIHRRLMRGLQLGDMSDRVGDSRPPVVRLQKINRHVTQTPVLTGLTSTLEGMEPDSWRLQRVVPQQSALGVRRRQAPFSSLAVHAMMMNPSQVLHAPTGTFSTDAGFVASRKPPRVHRRTLADLPKPLDKLLDEGRKRAVEVATTRDGPSDQFLSDTNAILQWELEYEDVLHESGPDFRYINQTVPDAFEGVTIQGNVLFEDDAPHTAPRPAPTLPVTRRSALRASRAVERLSSFEMQTTDGARQVAPNRRLTKLHESLAADDESEQPATPSASRAGIRRSKIARHVPESFMTRILTAIVAVRTLAGGFEGKMVDWGFVASAFRGYDPVFIQERGRNIAARQRLQIAKMQSDFQERFIEAYERGQVPPINYEDLEGYDWEGVVDWACTQLDIPSSTTKLPDMPATREQFDRLFEMREEPISTIDDIYQNNPPMTAARKRALFASVPFATLLERAKPTAPSRRAEELSELEVITTWVRANVVAPEETYNPAEARRILEYFGETLVSNAVQSLVTERVISMGNRGRVTPGRNYDITDHFLVTLGRKRAIDSAQLKRAARFKCNVLDPALEVSPTEASTTTATTARYEISYNAEDGDILAMINLAAQGQIHIHPHNPPKNKYGLTDGGYLTRLIDKTRLHFGVSVSAVRETYVFGNPLIERRRTTPPPMMLSGGNPPCTTTTTATGLRPTQKVPLWIDIHGNFIELLWEMVVAAVVGCVAVRPGIGAQGITEMLKPTMGLWEVRLVLEWMASVGAVRRVGEMDINERSVADKGSGDGGWVTQEWWWLVLA